MTLKEWQSSQELAAWAAKLFSDPNWKLLRQMLDTEHPKNYQHEYAGMSADRELGIIYGYDRFINNLEQTAHYQSNEPLPAPTYGADDETIEPKKRLTSRK